MEINPDLGREEVAKDSKKKAENREAGGGRGKGSASRVEPL